MVYCCPAALVEDVRGDGIARNGSCDDDDSASSGAMQVRFPPLPPNPPTDSETTTTTADDRQMTSSSSSDDQGNPKRRRCSSYSDGSEAPSAAGAPDDRSAGEGVDAHSPAELEAPQEGQPSSPNKDDERPPPQPQALSSASGSEHAQDVEDDELEIEEIDFSNTLGDRDSFDPALKIKAALNNLVATAKRRKKRLDELGKRKRNDGAPSAPIAADLKQTPSPSGGDSKKKPSLKQRPVQVIMTWMDSFQDHEKIQLICLQSLPTVLEDPPNRLAAQADGLASIVLYNMAAFPSNSLLQLTAFHTLVVLLRPLGANEGMVNKAVVHSHNSTSKTPKGIRSINARKKSFSHRHHHGSSKDRHGKYRKQSPTHQFSNGPLVDATYEPRWEENGVRVMLDSLRRFSSDRYLQAMGCWAMVNAALYPSLKTSLLKLGGVYTVTNAMMLHPNVEAVQFRGLFALINLVIPDNSKKKDGDGSSIHSHIYQIARLTIVAMRNFHTNKSILNRGCLVLRNLSLTPAFVKILARTPGCVDILLHCRQVCPRDVLVQRSARTIMILLQRVMENGNGGGGNADIGMNTFKLTQPRSAAASGFSTPGSAGSSPVDGIRKGGIH